MCLSPAKNNRRNLPCRRNREVPAVRSDDCFQIPEGKVKYSVKAMGKEIVPEHSFELFEIFLDFYLRWKLTIYSR